MVHVMNDRGNTAAMPSASEHDPAPEAATASAAMPLYLSPPALPDPSVPRPRLNGAHDLVNLFGLRPLYDAAVRPYMHRSRGGGGASGGTKAVLSNADASAAGGEKGSVKTEGAAGGHAEAGAGPSAPNEHKPLQSAAAPKAKLLPRTYAHYVQDIPGRVKPPRRPLPPRHAAGGGQDGAAHPIDEEAAAAAAAATTTATVGIAPGIGGTSMRDIVYRPETTIQDIVQFDDDTLAASFWVEAGDVPEIDASLLEPADDGDAPRKKRKKTKRKSQGGGGGAAGGGGGGG